MSSIYIKMKWSLRLASNNQTPSCLNREGQSSSKTATMPMIKYLAQKHIMVFLSEKTWGHVALNVYYAGRVCLLDVVLACSV